MTSLSSSFESDLKQAVMDDVEAKARQDIGPRLVEIARQNWQAYASRNGYDLDHIESGAELSVDRDGDTVRIRVEWPGLTALFEWGVDPHIITGDLHFYYEKIDQWIQTDSVNWGSETGGIPEARAIRDAVDEVGGNL